MRRLGSAGSAANLGLNESPSGKEGKSLGNGGDWATAWRLNESPSGKEGKCSGR